MTEKPKRRWFQLTPDRFLLGLLAVEGLLLLSEGFCWFPFNESKGWTVLVAVAAISVGGLVLFLWFAVSLLLGRRFQFGLRSLLAMVLVVAVACSWLATEVQQARRQREAVEAIWDTAGGRVAYDYEDDPQLVVIMGPSPSPLPAWLRELLGEDFFFDVSCVEVGYTVTSGNFGDEQMTYLAELTNLEYLHVAGDTRVTDAGLVHLEGLANLRELILNAPEVTDAGLPHLTGLTNLRLLDLSDTQVTGAGLEHLTGLTNLETLGLTSTQVTDVGLQHLKRLTTLESLYLNATGVTDAGLKHLKGLANLEELVLGHTQITDAGLIHLKGLNDLKSLHLDATHITDAGLEHLKGLANLQRLHLPDTRVTDAGLVHLKGTDLEKLSLSGTQVTDAGLVHLKGLVSIQVLLLRDTQITDAGLVHLKGLTNLLHVELSSTKVTDKGVEELRQASPGCLIERDSGQSTFAERGPAHTTLRQDK